MNATTNTEAKMGTETTKTHARRSARTGIEQMRAFADGSVTVCGTTLGTHEDVYANDARVADRAALESLVTCEACRKTVLQKRRSV